MSGHSKWSTIKRKKGKTDAERAKIFTKVGREIAVAVREGGNDPSSNGKLRDLIAKAKSLNVPNENIDRAIKKAGTDKADYEAIIYEGYGPSGVAVMVSCLTDNRNRTAGDLRHFFDKCGGNLGQSGSVGYLFTQRGVIVLEDEGHNEDALMELCLEAGAEDFSPEDDVVELYTAPAELSAAREKLDGMKKAIVSAEVSYIPSTWVKLDEDNRLKMERLLEMLEDNDDVQDVYHNWEE
ncbi:MAG: YebC/PmpR family DNA-binding transcriptional regulator [Oscillospiraceae bacterium]|nr:YebC/PmpR family DNA-binding transcriptional regulator [Oscillospiraceae bacterium]